MDKAVEVARKAEAYVSEGIDMPDKDGFLDSISSAFPLLSPFFTMPNVAATHEAQSASQQMEETKNAANHEDTKD